MASYRNKKRAYILNEEAYKVMHSPLTGGILLIISSIVALILSNLSATKEIYHYILSLEFTIGFENLNLTKSVEEWINDGLMVIFFFVVGLEIKREIIAGHLSTFKQAALPVAAALGGMLFPALIYLAFNVGQPTEPGWGIPMATDIAFAIGVCSLLGNKVPVAMKVFLAALAIADDLGAIIIIAIFYSSHIDWHMLFAALITLAFLISLNLGGVKKIKYYILPSILLWIWFLHSGIHATIAGVIIALTLPTTPRFNKKYFVYKSKYYTKCFEYEDQPGKEVLSNEEQLECLQSLRKVACNAISPSQRLEYSLHYTIAFVILPLFALANAGVEIDFGGLRNLVNSESLGIFFGLVVGKPLGIFLLSWISIKLGICTMPKATTWFMLFAVGCLGGIGFTMSIFMDNLAFTDPVMISTGKVAILVASVTAGLIGSFMIKWAHKASGRHFPVYNS